MKTQELNVKNITVKQIANGSIFKCKEATSIAKRILSEKRSSDFNRYRFFYPGANESVQDLYDCIVDYAILAGEIKVYNGKKQIKQYIGFSKEETLQKLAEDVFSTDEMDLQGLTFSVRGIKGRFPILLTAFHYYYGEGGISADKMLNMLREHEELACA